MYRPFINDVGTDASVALLVEHWTSKLKVIGVRPVTISNVVEMCSASCSSAIVPLNYSRQLMLGMTPRDLVPITGFCRNNSIETTLCNPLLSAVSYKSRIVITSSRLSVQYASII